MKTKAFNEDFLWKGAIQSANWPAPVQREPMDLPKINRLTGKPHPTNDMIFDEICEKTAAMSSQYWFGERLRRAAYRERFRAS
jgi:hypothetical protein